jgi:uncharacterized protein YjiK
MNSILNFYNIIGLLFILPIACAENTSQEKTMTEESLFSLESKSTVNLAKKLQELSGLAITTDGRLFGHDDERAVIYQIDFSKGSIIKSFSIGKKTLKKDFEGIAIVGELFYLVTSNGEIYEFREGKNKSTVPYEKYKTKLSVKNDVEGLCYDSDTESLLLACKGHPGKNYDGNRAVYSFSLTEKKLKKKPRFLMSIEEVNSLNVSDFTEKMGEFFLITESGFAPSGIEKHLGRNSFFILSSQGKMIIEVSADGKIVGKILLDKKHHNQPEGITFTNDNALLISDEGGTGKAKITHYPATRNK